MFLDVYDGYFTIYQPPPLKKQTNLEKGTSFPKIQITTIFFYIYILGVILYGFCGMR